MAVADCSLGIRATFAAKRSPKCGERQIPSPLALGFDGSGAHHRLPIAISRIVLLLGPTRVMDVLTAILIAIGETNMTTTEADGTRVQAAPAEASEPKATTKATRAPRKPRVAPTKRKASKKATPAQKRTKAPKAAKTAKPAKAPVREGSKAEKVLDLLKRPKGASLADLMRATSWQKHSVRGFLSGTIGKKMGLKLESVKEEGGERTYSIKA